MAIRELKKMKKANTEYVCEIETDCVCVCGCVREKEKEDKNNFESF